MKATSELIEVSAMAGRNWIADWARALGYPDAIADGLGWCAWWLENRGMRGFVRTEQYLVATRHLTFAQRQPDMDYADLVGVCPVMLGGTVGVEAHADRGQLYQWMGGIRTCDPLLAASAIAPQADYRYDLRMRFCGFDVLFCEAGISVTGEALARVQTDYEKGLPISVRFDEPSDRTIEIITPYRKRERVKISGRRYGKDGVFKFD